MLCQDAGAGRWAVRRTGEHSARGACTRACLSADPGLRPLACHPELRPRRCAEMQTRTDPRLQKPDRRAAGCTRAVLRNPIRAEMEHDALPLSLCPPRCCRYRSQHVKRIRHALRTTSLVNLVGADERSTHRQVHTALVLCPNRMGFHRHSRMEDHFALLKFAPQSFSSIRQRQAEERCSVMVCSARRWRCAPLFGEAGGQTNEGRMIVLSPSCTAGRRSVCLSVCSEFTRPTISGARTHACWPAGRDGDEECYSRCGTGWVRAYLATVAGCSACRASSPTCAAQAPAPSRPQ